MPSLAEPGLADPNLADPGLADPSLADPNWAEPNLAEPGLAEPGLAEPSLADPSLADPSLADPSLAEPSLADPGRAEPSRAEPGLAEPGLADPTASGPATAPFPPPPLALPHDPPRAAGMPGLTSRSRDAGFLGEPGSLGDSGPFADSRASSDSGAFSDSRAERGASAEPRLSPEPAAGDPSGPADRAHGGRAAAVVIPPDPRLGWWITRALLTTAVGIIVTFVAGWRLGLTMAAAAAMADALYRGRTSSVIPAGARVTSAQRRSRWRLTRLNPAGYLALHGRIVPGSGTVIHHLVVGPAGVYALRSERWDRRLPVRATQGGRLYHGPFDQAAQLEKVRDSAVQASVLISRLLGQQVSVRPAMAIYGPAVPWVVVKIGGVDVLCGRRLRRYLRREAYARRHRRLDDRQIELIHAAAAQVLPPVR